MEASQIPAYKFQDVFADDAASGNITYPIPDTTGTPGRASLQFGFPPDTFVPTTAGGVPPFGQDFNGLGNMITGWLQWSQAGGVLLPYDATFSAEIGGYPQGALLASASGPGLVWVSAIDNNTADPDSTQSNTQWYACSLLPLYSGTDTGTENAVVISMLAAYSAFADLDGRLLSVKKSATANTSGVTINVNSLGARALLHSDGSALLAGELPANGYFICLYDITTNAFYLQSLGYKLGTAATKAASNASDTAVASVASATNGQIPKFTDGSGTIGNSGYSANALVQAWAVTDGTSIFANSNVSGITNTGTGVYTVDLGITLSHGGAVFYSSGTTGGNSVWGGSGNNGGADITGASFTLTTNNAGGSGGIRANINTTGVLMIFGTQ